MKDRSVTSHIIQLKHVFKEASASITTAFPDNRSGVLVLPCMVQMMCGLLAASGRSAQLVPVDAADVHDTCVNSACSLKKPVEAKS